mgnify:CR=1 FL=1
MVVSGLKKGSSRSKENRSALAKQIKSDLAKLGMTQRDLAIRSGLPESRVSRILRGGNVRLTEQDINQLAIGLKKTVQERDALRYVAWPELSYVDEALANGENVIDLNCRLDMAGLPLLGNVSQE